MEFRVINNKKYSVGDITKINSGECYFIEGKYRRENAGYIAYDWTKRRYVMKSEDNLLEGFVLNDQNEVVMGYFSVEQGTPLLDITGKLYMSLEVAIKKGLSFDIGTASNILVESPKITSRKRMKETYPGINNEIYSAKDSPEFALKMKSPLVFKDNNETALLLAPFTYGVELETCSGNLPKMFLDRYLLVPLRDGSITGHEYVTIPHKFDTIIPYTVNACDALYDNCLVDYECSLHLHIGNLPTPDKLLVHLYSLVFRLQNELHELFAPFKKDLKYLSGKRGGAKDHCKYLPPMGYGISTEREIYDNIIKWVTHKEVNAESYDDGKRYSRINDAKWNIDSRYYIVQFTNYLFGKSPTVEFRLHSGTLDKYKTVFWIYICNAIIKFAISRSREIMSTEVKVTMAKVIRDIYGESSPELCQALLEYISQRRKFHINNVIDGEIYEDLNELYKLEEDFPMFQSDYINTFLNGKIRTNQGSQPGKKGSTSTFGNIRFDPEEAEAAIRERVIQARPRPANILR